jgi:hypothetical protein
VRATSFALTLAGTSLNASPRKWCPGDWRLLTGRAGCVQRVYSPGSGTRIETAVVSCDGISGYNCNRKAGSSGSGNQMQVASSRAGGLDRNACRGARRPPAVRMDASLGPW